MRVISCIAILHDPWLVLLAACVCVAGGWVGLRLFRRARQRHSRQRAGWTFLAAVATGASVWCTHFIAMLAYKVDAPVAFEPVLTVLSLLLVIAGATAAFALGNQEDRASQVAGGALLGLSIAGMHYAGMMAYHVDGIVRWDATYVLASVVIAVAFGIGALVASANRLRWPSLILFVLTVTGLHFTGMTAFTVDPLATGAPIVDQAVLMAMAAAVTGVSLLIVGTGVASYMIDNEATENSVEKLRQMALSDGLTGLPNRISFSSHLRQEMERAPADHRIIAVIGIDLDRFKEINDIRGHDAGDHALKAIGQRMSLMLRDGEFVARMGGDEFAAVKRFGDISELAGFITRLDQACAAPIHLDGLELAVGASIGVSIYPQDGDSAERLVGNADLAMYRAKASIGQNVCYYEAQMDELARKRRDLELELRQAAELDQLELHFQVQQSVSDRGAVTGYEVLLRWNHPARGRVPPEEFIPLAEESGAILDIGAWVLRTACRAAAAWPRPDKIAVNLSAVQLVHSDIARLVHETLVETGLSPSRLELEITESCIIHDKVRALHALRQIRALGVTIAIDDFGTGYSSLDTLRSFPFDRIKLDKSFMNELIDNPQSRAIVRAVLALGKSLDIKVLAEGVETEAQLDVLRGEGCDEAQGYLLGRPGPLPLTSISRTKAA